MEREMPRLTVTLPGELLAEVRSRAGRGGVSAWIAQAAADRLARERLAVAISEYEQESGPITDRDIADTLSRTVWSPEPSHPAA